MNRIKISILSLMLFAFSSLHAQHIIKPTKGYSPQIGTLVDMIEDLKDRMTESVKDLSIEETDFLIDDKANSIGTIIMHIAATELYYQAESLENRSWTEEEEEFWNVASNMGDESRAQLKGKPIKYYLKLWDQVREKSLEGLKTKDDEWLASKVAIGLNHHYIWFHVLEHQAAHMGQIDLIKNKLPSAQQE